MRQNHESPTRANLAGDRSRSVSVRRSALEKQKARISDMFAKFNQDEDEIDQQEALRVINSIAKTSIQTPI
jgi:hypothetical protein